METRLTAVSLFSGCGGFDWGAHQAGIDILWANDNDPHAAAAYKALFPNTQFILNDIRAVELEKIPPADIVIGCYPCTGFSVAARRRWREQPERNLRSNNDNFLFREFVRVLGHVKPKYFFVENVRGMATASNGWFLRQQLDAFMAAGPGYRVNTPEMLDASQFGTPQSRKRLFIVGVRNDIGFQYRFPSPTHGAGTGASLRSLKDAIGDTTNWPEWPEGEYFDFKFHGHYLTRNRKRGWDDPSYTIVANAHHVPLHPMGEPMENIGKDKWKLQGDRNRRLSWKECAAIQGLPSKVWERLSESEAEGHSISIFDRYRVAGNAVPPHVGAALLQPVVCFERGSTINPVDN